MTTASLSDSRTVLVLGANGRFGLAATQAFAQAGWRVLAHVRRNPAEGMPSNVELVRAPLGDVADALSGRPAPSIVVHAINPIYTRWDTEALPAARIAMDLSERFAARLMLPGNVYNYGEAMPPVLTPTTPQRPTTEKGRIRCEMEAELERRAAVGRLEATVITAGDFFGAGRGSWFDLAIVKGIARGRLDYPGDPQLVHAWAYLPDLAKAFVAVATARARPSFERFTFAGHAVTGDDFLDAVEHAAATLGIEPAGGWRHGRLPWSLIRAVGLVVPMWRELARMSYLWRVPHALDGHALQSAAGPLPHTPLVEALTRSLRELGVSADRPVGYARALEDRP